MRVKMMMLLLLCFGVSQIGRAQNGTKDQSQSDLSAMRTDVRALQAEQQQIITRLDELKHVFLECSRRDIQRR
jgi:hypothetical protein